MQAGDEPQELGQSSAIETGVPAVDAALERLAELEQLPTADHVEVFDGVHRRLQDALADLDGG